MSDDLVLTDVADGIATITLNRPAQLNAVDEPTRRALLMALIGAVHNLTVGAVILTGAGRAFCVGQDLAASNELEDCEDCVRRTYNPVVDHIAGLAKPVIGAVNGPAVGAGMGFALACDMVLMAEDAFLSCAFGKVGLIPDSATTYHLARAVGHRRAFEMATSGRRIGAEEAVTLGLANRAVSADALLGEARALAATLVAGPAKSITLTKNLLRRAAETSIEAALEAEALAQGVLGSTTDHRERRAAFVAKAAR